jgi:hypothetical protein
VLPDLPAHRREHAREEVQQDGLAAAVGAEQADARVLANSVKTLLMTRRALGLGLGLRVEGYAA